MGLLDYLREEIHPTGLGRRIRDAGGARVVAARLGVEARHVRLVRFAGTPLCPAPVTALLDASLPPNPLRPRWVAYARAFAWFVPLLVVWSGPLGLKVACFGVLAIHGGRARKSVLALQWLAYLGACVAAQAWVLGHFQDYGGKDAVAFEWMEGVLVMLVAGPLAGFAYGIALRRRAWSLVPVGICISAISAVVVCNMMADLNAEADTMRAAYGTYAHRVSEARAKGDAEPGYDRVRVTYGATKDLFGALGLTQPSLASYEAYRVRWDAGHACGRDPVCLAGLAEETVKVDAPVNKRDVVLRLLAGDPTRPKLIREGVSKG